MLVSKPASFLLQKRLVEVGRREGWTGLKQAAPWSGDTVFSLHGAESRALWMYCVCWEGDTLWELSSITHS